MAVKVWRAWRNFLQFITKVQKFVLQVCAAVIPVFLFLSVALIVYDLGYRPFWSNSDTVNFWLTVILDGLFVIMGVRLLLEIFSQHKLRTRVVHVLRFAVVVLLTFWVMPVKASYDATQNRYIIWKLILYSGLLLGFIVEVSQLLQNFYRGRVSPALLFVMSFALLILLGTFLLKLPNATTQELSALDALFTAASAVCVTGLIVVDTATHFTSFGKLIIMLLIQFGALGIMTFAGLFAYAVAGGASIKTQLAFKDVMSGRQIGNVMRFTYNVVMITLLFELMGAIGIYFSVPSELFRRELDRIFFAVFHAISAFSNAGFSTLSNGLYEPVVRFNYSMQFFIALLIILGGMGFPIVFNLYRYLQVKLVNLVYYLERNPRRIHFPKLISLNSRLALVVSTILLIIGFVTYFMFEIGNSLDDHPSLGGKIMTSFFGSVTPRTAGFNTVDLQKLSLPIVMIYLLMMWIGASPGSTGGGIKTTTVGVAVLNMMSVLRGKDRTEFYRSEVSNDSLRRAFAVIFMSLLFIGVSVFLVSINDSSKGLIKIAFEVFSAFGTVGLTLGITHELSSFSKAVIIITMFVGRIGTVTLMVAFIRQTKNLYYRYPKEDITF